MTERYEYRLIWDRGNGKRRRIMQTLSGAENAARRMESAHREMDWLQEPLDPLIVPVVIERRTVGDWDSIS